MLRRTFKCISVTNRNFSTLSYKHNPGKMPFLGTTIGRILEKSAEKFPDVPAVVSKHDRKTLTFSDLLRRADKLAAAFRNLGLRQGDRVGIWSPNSAEYEVAFLGCARAGMIAAHLNPGYTSKEMEYCVKKVGLRCVVCPDRSEKHDFLKVLGMIDSKILEGKCSERVPTLEKVVVISDEPTRRGTVNFHDIEERVTERESDVVRRNQDKISMDSGATIMFTSGSTGNPKAVLVSHFNIVNNSFQIQDRLQISNSTTRLLVQVPFFHTFGTTGCIILSLHSGTTLVIPSPYYNSDENIKALESENCNIICGIPTMFVDLMSKLKKKKERRLSVEFAVIGGAPSSPKLIQDMYDVLGLKNVLNVFGMTEATATTFQSLLTDDLEKVANTIGYVGDNVEVKIVDTDGNIVPCGTPGELYVRGYMTMLGYYNDEKKTRETIKEDGWLRTGDKMILTEDGYGKIVGRISDLIIRGGENIYPKQVEDVVNGHPKIMECHVVGLPHERLGEEVCACVRVKPGEILSKAELRDFCQDIVSHHQIPTRLFIVNEFPKTMSGKIQKFRLVERITNGDIQETV